MLLRACILAGLICANIANSQGGLRANGSLQFDAIARYTEHQNKDSSIGFAGMSLITLDVQSVQTQPAKIAGSLDLYLLYGDYTRFFAQAAQGTELLEGMRLSPVTVDLRTLYAALYFPVVDITLGRQIVNFGEGLVYSPIDVFSAINFFDLGFRRSGSDIAMASIAIGTLSGLDVIAELPVHNQQHATAVKAFTTLHNWDLSLVGLYRHKAHEAVGGVSFKGDAIVGLYGELVERYNRASRQWAFEGMFGMDYSIGRSWFFSTEYLFREQKIGSDPFRDRHNLYASVRYAINDLMNVSIVGLAALPARRGMATLQYSYNILERVDTIWYLRYYNVDLGPLPLVPDGEAGVRVAVGF